MIHIKVCKSDECGCVFSGGLQIRIRSVPAVYLFVLSLLGGILAFISIIGVMSALCAITHPHIPRARGCSHLNRFTNELRIINVRKSGTGRSLCFYTLIISEYEVVHCYDNAASHWHFRAFIDKVTVIIIGNNEMRVTIPTFSSVMSLGDNQRWPWLVGHVDHEGLRRVR